MENKYVIEPFTEHTPPNLERVFGYRGAERWVAFFWGKKIDNYMLCYGFDGKIFNPVSQTAWDAFFSHPLIVAMMYHRDDGMARKRFEFGDEHVSSRHWLLLDRWERMLYAADKESSLYYLKTINDMASEMHSGVDFDSSALPETELPEAEPEIGELQRLNDMLEWLDKRKNALVNSGRWPVLN